MKQNSQFLKERILIEDKDKFYPVKKYAVDLSEFTFTNKERYLKSDRKWYLKIEDTWVIVVHGLKINVIIMKT